MSDPESHPSESQRDPEPLLPRDSRLETFLRKAAPILAMERGVTESAGLKLRAIANELRLPEQLFEQAMAELGRDWAKGQLSRGERNFLSFLSKELRALPRQILTERLEQRAIKIGVDKFQLSPDRARDLVRREAAELGFNRVSRSEAENYIRQLSTGTLAGLETEDVKHQRLLEAAKTWGLSEADVEEILRTARSELRRERQLRASAPTRVALAVTLVLGLVASGLGWWIVQRNRPGKPSSTTSSPTAPTPVHLPQPTWWDGTLYQMASRSAETSPSVRAFVVSSASEDPETRARAVANVIAGPPLDPKSGLTNELILRVLLSEPDETLLTQSLTTMLDSLDEPTQLPSIAHYRVARNNLELWKLASQQQATGQLDRNSPAGKLVASLSAGLTGVTPAILSERYLAAVAALAPQNPRSAAGFLANAPLPAEVSRSAAFNEAVFAVLEADVETWRDLRPVLTRLVATADRTSLIPWLDWVDARRDSDLARFLAQQIADQLKTRLPAGEIADQRTALQRILVPPSPFQQNLEARRLQVLERVAELRRRPRSLEAQAQSIANETYLATLAWCWWCCQQSERAEFGPLDDLLKQNVRELARSTGAERPGGAVLRQANRLATAVDRDTYLAALARLGESAASDSAKLQSLQQLAAVADRFPDIDSDDAQRIATYVLAAREQDLSEVEGALWAMRHWPTLILTLFDTFEAAPPDSPRAAIVLRALVPSVFPEGSQTLRKSNVAPAVLNYLIGGLSESIQISSGVQARPWGQLELYFLEMMQARVAVSDLAFERGGGNATEFDLNRLQRDVIESLLSHARLDKPLAERFRRRGELAWREDGSLPRAVLQERALLELSWQLQGTPAESVAELSGRLDANSQLPDLLLEIETNLVDVLLGESIPPR